MQFKQKKTQTILCLIFLTHFYFISSNLTNYNYMA